MKFSFWPLALIFVISIPGQGAPPAKAHLIQKDFKSAKKDLEEADLKQRKVFSALYGINKKIKKFVTEKSILSQQMAVLEGGIQNLSAKVEGLEKTSAEQKALLSERLRAIYKLKGPSIARFLFSSRSSASLETNLKILGIVAARDLEMIKNYERDRRDLERQKRMLSERLESVKSLESKIVKQENELLQEQELKNKILNGIRQSRHFALKKIDVLKQKTLEFNGEDSGLFDMLFKPSFADQKGILPRPLSGIVTQKFGLIKGEDQPYTVSHKGVFISASKGTPIKSVFEGRVSFVGELLGFGTTLIVDHGDHYYSVYSHAQDVRVTAGEEIKQAQVLAQVGESLDGSQSGLYFEIRHFSEPYDPQKWMKGL